MKSYNAKSGTAIDRIERAVELINAGAIFEHHKGVWRVLTDRFAGGYTVQDGKCDCYDFETTLQGQTPCKHLYAVEAAAVCLFIHDIRTAGNQQELDDIVAEYKDALKSAPAAYVAIARNEYRIKRDALKASRRIRLEEEANAVLVKPQPASNGRYGSVEI